jgi:biopolymer transport protein ExbB
MKKLLIGMLCITFFGLVAYEGEDPNIELFTEDDETLVLESQLDALLEDEILAEEGKQELHGCDILLGLDGDEVIAPIPSHYVDSSLRVQNTISQFEEVKQETAPFSVEPCEIINEKEKMVMSPQNTIETISSETTKSIQTIEINLRQVFSGSPIIYTVLFFLSTISFCVWIYTMLTIRSSGLLPPKIIKDLRNKLIKNQFDEAIDLCIKQKHFFCKMLASGIMARRHGLNMMVDTMKTEGKRSTVAFWQQISILNEIAIIAPMLGLLGTVLGMFYAFYDLNRSIESVSLLFDGLGISVGTTVAGLIVAILAMIFYSIAKYRLVRTLAIVENEAQSFAALIDTRYSKPE